MLRFVLALLASVTTLSLASAQTPESDRARKVRVALALAGCGTCRSDLEECRADALKTGKPLLLFINGCDGQAKELDGSAIYCRVAEYRIDGKPAEGIVVLGRVKGEKTDSLFILDRLKKDATVTEITAAVKLAKEKAPPVKASAPVDWDFGKAPEEPEPLLDQAEEDSDLAPVGIQLFQDCPGGRCAVPTSSAGDPSVPGAVSVPGSGSIRAERRKLLNRPILNFPIFNRPLFPRLRGLFAGCP